MQAELEAQLALIERTCLCMACRSAKPLGLSGLPPSYVRCQLVGQSPIDVRTGLLGLVLEGERGEKIRVALSPETIDSLVATLNLYRGPCCAQSLKSSESPNELGSPQEGL